MNASLFSNNRKPLETTQNHSTGQREIRAFCAMNPPGLTEGWFIAQATWEGVLRYAVQRTGRDDFEVADEMHISHGQMSKVLRGSAGFWGARLVAFMRKTQSLAPLQWLAAQMDCEVRLKPRDEREVLRARLAQLETNERSMA